MKTYFADSGYFIAVVNRHDELHEKAASFFALSHTFKTVTSEMTLAELLNYFAEWPRLRDAAAKVVLELRRNSHFQIVPQSNRQFTDALNYYLQFSDKEWSLTDCANIQIMKRLAITEALTYDHHFVQAGFTALLRD